MNYYTAILQYDGTGLQGFQHQEGARTIQGDINLALEKILEGEFATRAASRTDKGVHALAQMIKISATDPTPLSLERFNTALPSHIKALSLTPCSADFIPSIDQSSKEYRYLFTTTDDQRFIAMAPAPLNMEAMKTCATKLKGTHDFKNFWSIGGVSNTTVREILDCELSEINPQDLFRDTIFTTDLSRSWQFKIHGRGFLKHMVRHLIGALWLVGIGELTIEDFENYLMGDLEPQRPWKKADPRGLFLVKVHYL
ncbi:MAG: tRNA pseudouridine(38-40) synthase TruA [Bacteriovoracaceae bacterium]|nr:tRNA pseudouridine(38-40) synthase TruA [Bacteriovoracaceae bacterium]